jgi:hypothetical protein
MTPTLWFVAPPFDGPVSGGTLYNREIVKALTDLGASVTRLDPDAARRALLAGTPGLYVVDTLYSNALAELAQENRSRRTLALLAHYLPSLVSKGESVTMAELEDDEKLALRSADAFVAPSVFMQRTLARLGSAGRPAVVVEPATLAPGVAQKAPRSGPPRAMIVANLTPGKGVELFLTALARLKTRGDAFELEIVGSQSLDPEYARACVAAAENDPRIRFSGALEPAALLERLAACDVLISASRMESFGMAIAEARTLGVPIVARTGGNVAELVSETAGGSLSTDEAELAREFLALCRDAGELARRAERARRHARPPRAWSDAARELLAGAPRLERAPYEK